RKAAAPQGGGTSGAPRAWRGFPLQARPRRLWSPATARAIGTPMRLIIFDCDGTLVDSQHMIVAPMTLPFHANSLELPMRDRILSIVGLSLPIAIARLLPANADKGLVDQVAEAYRKGFFELRQDPCYQEPMFPGALEA